ncbi:haspin [Colletes latitarsis]|uniref:haspin n=1 Tax=Colletes latitarsis TaxID=2605962 RepID=UPI0040354E49
MNYKVPIRTYGRKTSKEIVVPLQKLHVTITNNIDDSFVSIKKELSVTKKSDNNDNSAFYDPFETTFDKLVKDTGVQSLKTSNTKTKYTNTDDSANSSIATSNKIDSEHSLYNDIKLPNANVKFISKPKVRCKKPKMQIEKKTLVKKNRSTFQNNKSQVKKNNTCKKYKSRNNKKISSTNTNTDILCLNSEINTSKFEDHYSNYSEVPNKKSNSKCAFRENEKKNNVLNSSSNENVKVMSCYVILDKLKPFEQKHEISHENNSAKETEISIEIYDSLEHPEIIKTSINDINHSNIHTKHCFVKIDQLEMSSIEKPLTFSKKYDNMISSTPSGKSVRPSTNLISLSPIPTKYSEKLNESTTYTDSIITCTSSKDNLVSLQLQQRNADLCGKSDASEEHIIKENTELNEKNTASLAALNNTSNNNNKQSEHTIEVTSEILDSMKNIFTTEMEEDNVVSVSSKLIQEHAVSDTVKRNHLNFSIDVNRSRSLFSDTDESIQTSLCNVNTGINIVNVSTSNLILRETNRELSNETYSNSAKLSEKSTSNINNKIDFESKNTSVIKETENLLDKNSTLSTNKSFVNDDDKCNNAMEPFVVLNQLEDSIKITHRRKRYCKWELDLTNILEDDTQFKENQIYSKRMDESKQLKLSKKALQPSENIIETFINNTPMKVEKPIYLKPGKSWARSLSILNNIQNESNLDRLSVGKGKKWRDIVIDVLNMQNQGIIQSCVSKTENDKELHASNEIINKTEDELATNKGRTCDSTNFGRLSRRISVRVVPINKTIKFIEDAPFLEVYGIVPVKSQRFTLINDSQNSSECNIQNNDISEIVEDHAVFTAKDVILERCSQKDYILFSTYFSDSYLEHCRKIGEGVYGEVFLHEYEDKKSVIKIIPIEGNEHVNGEPQKKFHEILSEIVIAMELHNLRFNKKYNTDGFVEVKNIKCLRGEYPKKLVELWNIYDEEKRSENDCPSMFNDNQLYIILELGHGGQDLEAFVFDTAEEAHILFIQAALALAVAEKAIEFEHRDLHWGNILISPTTESHISYKLGKKKIKLISKGVKVSIIDFTLSRVTYQECSIFNDLASDPSLFIAQGEYQFEIYRLMRDKIKNNWQKFEPYTNILWLHYTLDKMITAVRYRRRNLKNHKNGLTKLKELKNKILMYSSAFDFVTNCDQVARYMCIDSESELASI